MTDDAVTPAAPPADAEAVRRALQLAPGASSRDHTIDITTIGARSGQPRRIETWFHYVLGRWFLSGRPGPRDWAANLRANPDFTFHLKHGVHADLPATASPITDAAAKREIVEAMLGAMGRGAPREVVDAWVEGSPLFEVTFRDAPLRPHD